MRENDGLTTWQDYLNAPDRDRLVLDTIAAHKASAAFRTALEASAYFRGENLTVAGKTVLRAGKVETRDENGLRRVRAQTRDVVGNRIASNFLYRFVTQQTQYLLGNGVCLGQPGLKERLGGDFDRVLARMGELALLHGVCWGLWDQARLEPLPIAQGPLAGFVPLPDELTGEALGGIQFWQLTGRRPMLVRLLEPRGQRLYRAGEGTLTPLEALRPWTQCPAGRTPLVPLWGNASHVSEFTPAIRSKIDAFDRIFSDFADNLDRANDVYWVLNNFAGTSEDIAELLEEISRLKAVASLSDGTGAAATAEPHTIAVPFEARQAALRLLERELYRDWMALDVSELTGGSLTNVAIRTAAAELNLKADGFEWQCFCFVRALLRLLGVDTDAIRFKRGHIANESEIVRDISVMRPDIDRRTALVLNPYIQTEEVGALLGEREKTGG